MPDAFEGCVTELMRRPLGEFAAARTELARRARQAGDAGLAGRIAALRKPSLVVWVINQLASVAADDVAALGAAGQRLAAAQQAVLEGDRLAPPQMSQALQDQRRHIDALSRRAGMVLTANGHAAAETTLRRVADALRDASVAGAETWAALVAGRLLDEPRSDGFLQLDAGRMQSIGPVTLDPQAEERRRQVLAAQAEVDRAEEIERIARENAAAAAQRLDDATQAVADARRALAQLETRIAED